MSYVKLDVGLLDSSLWAESAEVRLVFVTMLLMTRPDGLCEATAPGIANRARLPLDAVRHALEILEAPDPDSRTLEDDGRRIRRVDGGYLVLNFIKYRNKDHTAAARKRLQRERERGESRLSRVTTVTERDSHRMSHMSRVTTVTERDSHRMSHTQTQKQKQKKKREPAPADAGHSCSLSVEPFEEWWELYRTRTGRGAEKAGTLEAYQRLSPEDREALVKRTEAWFAARAALSAVGAFVPEPPDPKRFIRKRRWEDELSAPGESSADGVPREPTPTEVLIREQLEHEGSPRWREYRSLVVAHRLEAGSWARWVAGEVSPTEAPR